MAALYSLAPHDALRRQSAHGLRRVKTHRLRACVATGGGHGRRHEACGKGRSHRRDPRRALPRAAHPPRSHGPVHVAGGSGSQRTDHRQKGQSSDAAALRPRWDTAGHGFARSGRDSPAHPRGGSGAHQGQESKAHGGAIGGTAPRSGSIGSRRARSVTGGGPQDCTGPAGASVWHSRLPRGYAHSPTGRSLGSKLW